MFLQMIGSLKTVPPRMFLMVPLGLFHIFFSLNSVRTGIRQTHHSSTFQPECTQAKTELDRVPPRHPGGGRSS